MSDVYWGSRKEKWSIREGGIVRMRTPNLVLRDVRFIIYEGEQARARRLKQKNIHAIARGRMAPELELKVTPFRAKYNPYQQDQFEVDGRPVSGAMAAYFHSDGRVYLEGPVFA